MYSDTFSLLEIVSSDTLEKETLSCDGIVEYVKNLLEEIQTNVYQKALNYRNSQNTKVDIYYEIKEKIEEGGFILAHWDGTVETEEKIKEETKATIRCIPFETFLDDDKEPGTCMVTCLLYTSPLSASRLYWLQMMTLSTKSLVKSFVKSLKLTLFSF